MSDDRRSEDGFTFVELIVTVVIMSMIIGAISMSFVTALRSSAPTTERIRQSNDAQLIASFLVRDAQAAGGTDPTTVAAYTSLNGFATTPTPVPVPGVYLSPLSSNIGSFCAAPGDNRAEFNWNDRVSATETHGHIVIYSLDGNALKRTTCVDGGAPSTITLGNEIASATGSTACDSTCPAGLPTSVTLHVTSTPPSNGPAYVYDLTASLRPDNDQDVPTNGNASPAPLLTLGGVGCTDGTTGFDVGGNPDVTIYGQVAINATDAAGCSAMYLHGAYNYASGAVSVLNGGTCSGCTPPAGSYTTPFGDPYASTLGPLASQCATAGNPAPTGGAFHPGASPLVFKNLFNSGNVFFDHGTYVFCAGLTAGTITTPPLNQPGVTFYIVSGGLTTAGNASVSINGLLYAPTSIVTITGNGTVAHITSMVVGALVVQGTPSLTVGTAPAVNISITGPGTLPSWTINRTYPSAQMTAAGGGGIYSWSATNLPPGLSINPATGLISGTPNTAGSYAPKVTVVDSLGDNATRSYTVSINQPPSITGPATLQDWTINRDYPGTAILATGGTTAYAWSATGLPNGLSINASSGVVSGTPSATGTFTPTITLTDATGATDTQGYTIKINSTPSITGPATLPDWTVNQSGYPSQPMTATNGTLPYTWAASGLPPGLGINAGTGVISGTPNATGTFSVSVTVTDKAGASNTRNYTVTINPVPGIATASLPASEIGVPYNFTLTPNGGGTPPFTWSLPTKPGWLSINANTGALSGTPVPPTGTPNVTVKVTDSTGASTSKTYSLTVAAAVQITGPATLPNWTINRDYPGTAIIGTGGVTPFTWSATGLPSGLSINTSTGVISGTPSATGTSTIVVTVSDAAGGSDTQSYTVTISSTPSISTSSLPNGEQSVFYSTTIAASNGTTPYSWAGSGLPNGLTINAASGVLSGTPTVFGTFSITVTATDAAGASVSKNLNITLTDAPTVGGPSSLPNWTVGKVYPNPQVFGAGGTAPYTYTLTGTLPAGLSLNGSTGVISGTPTTAQTRTFSIVVHDAQGATITQSYTVTINSAPSVTTASLPAGTNGSPYVGATLAGSNGTTPYTWSATGLPANLTLNPATGAISGTPASAGTFSVTVTLTDAAGATATHAPYTLTVNPPASITSAVLQNGGLAGTIDQGDTITVVFSAQMKVSSFCSSWANDANNQALNGNNDVTVTANDGGGAANDSISVTSGTCTFNFGSISLGSSTYVSSGPATFTGKNGNKSSIAWTAASHTLVITLGAKTAGTVANVASSTPVYSAGPITDPGGAPVSNTPFTLTTGIQF